MAKRIVQWCWDTELDVEYLVDLRIGQILAIQARRQHKNAEEEIDGE
jgi:hypothetical protein